MITWITFTSLGGINAMAPAAAVIATGLVMGRAWRMALWWCVLFSLGMGVVLASKLAFAGWCIGIPALDFTGFSGHAMRATAVAPVLAFIMLQHAGKNIQMAGVLFGFLFGIAISVSRLALHVHSTSEAVAGCILGSVVSVSFIWRLARSEKILLHRPLIVVSLIILLAVPYTEPLPTQSWVVTISKYLSGKDQTCSRNDWTISAAE